ISVTWTEAPINDVLLAFAAFSGKSIVPGANVEGFVTADINDQPWDVALSTILAGQGLVGEEDTNGIIRVDNISDINEREQIEPILTRAYRISYGTVAEIQTLVTPLLTERGNASSSTGANTLVVSDIQRVQNAVSDMLQQLDVETPQVSIQAKIIFVNRTELDELGVTYELKDSRGNQLNRLSSGFVDPDGDGPLPATEVQQGTQTVLLGGNSIAALGNATNRVTAPSLQLLTSMVIGRHTLVSFIDALESVQLSDIEATPQLTVLDNQPADLLVGELTPIRVVDAGAAGAGGGGGGGGGGGQFPTAQVEQQETGIKLQATPHVTGDKILLEVLAERSAAELADSDAGFIFRTQRAQTRVLVGDGETVVIGGLTQSERIEAVAGIPLLMDLPLIGGLFRIRRDQEIQRDLIILVTPTLVRSSLR
ncbi:MAG: secretin N-terminal domain-containing protein, partial [Longimicrobiales bacterium]